LDESRGRKRPGALANVSVVIPIGPGDLTWQSLALDLANVDGDFELVFVATDEQPERFNSLVAGALGRCDVRWITTAPGRAHQMNRGAEHAHRPFLWFLHADSQINGDAVSALQASVDAHSNAIHYFDLEFQSDGPRLARINACGVRFRSRYLGLPFGDQGLCLSRELFSRLGRFNEEVMYGEDHLLIWSARHERVPILPVGTVIATSARKYATNGWLATTSLHTWRTWRQAIPQLAKLLWNRCG
jgi:hypothetical protein